MYRGVRFRSRLEARWAAFLDSLGWHWQYEPIDLHGYIPDFIVRFDWASLLIEVKPSVSIHELLEHRHKVEASGWDGEVLLVGSGIRDIEGPSPLAGVIAERERMDRDLEFQWSPARLFRCLSCGSVSVLSEDYSWRCRSCGVTEHHIGHVDLFHAWLRAGNRVQWRKSA
jgi:hypothetical protein